MKKINPSPAFSLIELLIVVALIGIIAVIAYPSYTRHVVRAKRLAAALQLEKIASGMEKYYTLNNSYAGASLVNLQFPDANSGGYQFLITSATGSEFKLQANPIGHQAQQDPQCGSLTLNDLGEKGVTGTLDVANCWH